MIVEARYVERFANRQENDIYSFSNSFCQTNYYLTPILASHATNLTFKACGVFLITPSFVLTRYNTTIAGNNPTDLDKKTSIRPLIYRLDDNTWVSTGRSFPEKIVYGVPRHSHTSPGGQEIGDLNGVDVVGSTDTVNDLNYAKITDPLQMSFVVRMQTNERLFLIRDLRPRTYIKYEVLRLAPAMFDGETKL